METLKVRGTLQDIEPVINYAVTAAHEAGFKKQELHRVRLAVDEIATNIVVHGYKEAGRSGDLSISTKYDEEQLTIFLEDTGEEYDPRNALPPNMDSSVGKRPLGGLGVYLALWAVDQFFYEHKKNRNRSTLIVQKPCPHPPCHDTQQSL
ncbi:MAG: anti-sigma regulatory factor [Aquificales bacterium]|nr:anti-sigma regulatory factor [Aquificales bacterium]